MVWRSHPAGGAWSPWQQFERIQDEMRALFTPEVRRLGTGKTSPPVNLWSGPNGMLLTARVAGYRSEDLEIDLDGRELTLRGKRAVEEPQEETTVHLTERAVLEFERSVQLPFVVDEEQVTARFQNGILEVELPKAPEERPRRIDIQNA